jgi:SAM-dependent methyltransferase
MDEACLACGGMRWRSADELQRVVRSRFPGVRLDRCRNCGMGQVRPLPSAAAVAAIYRDPQYAAAYAAAGQSYVLDPEHARSAIRQRLSKLERLLGSPGSLLDVGAARGVFLAAAREAGWRVSGLETDPSALEEAAARYGLRLQPQSLEGSDFAKGSFDCVHLSHVLEHLRSPSEALTRIRPWLRRGGILALEVPYEFGDLFERFQSCILGKPRLPYAVPSPHLYFFTVASLQALLRRCGYEIVALGTLRRNAVDESRYLGGRWLKRLLYWLEQRCRWGPLIEVYARPKLSRG